MAASNSYKVISVPGEVVVASLGSSSAPSLVFGNPDTLGGMNDGFYGTSTPTIGLSINGTSVMTWSASGLVTGNIATSGTIASASAAITGAITGASVAVTGALTSSSPTAGIGYATGAGSSVTQGTSKSQATTLNAITGAITMNNAALAAGVLVAFTLTNSAVDLDDVVIVNHSSAGTSGRYNVFASSITAGSFAINVQNIGATSLSEAIVLSYAVIKSVAA